MPRRISQVLDMSILYGRDKRDKRMAFWLFKQQKHSQSRRSWRHPPTKHASASNPSLFILSAIESGKHQ